MPALSIPDVTAIRAAPDCREPHPRALGVSVNDGWNEEPFEGERHRAARFLKGIFGR